MLNFKQRVIRTASKMYGISISRSTDLVEKAFLGIHEHLPANVSVKEEDILLFIGRIVLPCIN